MQSIILTLFIWNLITCGMMGIDKYKAIHHHYRISECTLLLTAVCFGSIGILIGMLMFHHKIRKAKFIFIVPLCILWQGILIRLVLPD